MEIAEEKMGKIIIIKQKYQELKQENKQIRLELYDKRKEVERLSIIIYGPKSLSKGKYLSYSKSIDKYTYLKNLGFN